ncbi:MAG: hypothetical protein JNL26_06610 [Gemmatimonadetes bacterium]|nr:hypothetical protein [Gemmatimonadota bacterium]
MRCTKWIAGAVMALVVVPSISQAQGKGFQPGYTDIGATVGLGNVGGALALGGRFEKAIKKLPDLGDGTLGFQVGVDYWNYNERFVSVDYDFRYIAFSGTANYHFKVTNTKIDPFLGAGLGLSSVSTDFTGSASSGLYFIGRAGIRYFMSEKAALYADAGASGAATINLGFMFGLKPGK